MDWDDAAEGNLGLAILLKLFSLVGSGDQENILDLEKSFFSVYMLYHLVLLGVFTNWSLNSLEVSEFLDG